MNIMLKICVGTYQFKNLAKRDEKTVENNFH